MSETPLSHETETRRPGLVQLSVPEDLYEDVIEFIAQRRRAQRSRDSASPSAADELEKTAPASPEAEPSEEVDDGSEPPWDSDTLRGLLDQANDRVVTALVALARSPSRQLSTEEITEAAGLRPGRSWGGFISRAQASSRHRWQRSLPIRWVDWHGRNDYGMDERDADVIRQWADEHEFQAHKRDLLAAAAELGLDLPDSQVEEKLRNTEARAQEDEVSMGEIERQNLLRVFTEPTRPKDEA